MLVDSNNNLNSIIKCVDNPRYFIEKYCKYVNIRHGVLPITLNFHQNDLLEKLYSKQNKTISEVYPRQVGITTLIALFALWYSIFNSGQTMVLMSYKEVVAKELLERIKIAYTGLPEYLKLRTVQNSRSVFSFENGSCIIASGPSSHSIRGLTINYLIGDNFVYMNEEARMDVMRSIIPIVGKYALVKTE